MGRNVFFVASQRVDGAYKGFVIVDGKKVIKR